MDITLIVALIAAIAAIVAPLISALIAAHSAYKIKTVELFFNAKAKAYLDFHSAIALVAVDNDFEAVKKLQTAASHAELFSSAETQEKISLLCSALLNDNPPPDSTAKLGDSYQATIQAMQSELHKYRK